MDKRAYDFPGIKELELRIQFVIEFMLKHTDRFDQYETFWPRSEDASEGFPEKILTEFALLLFLGKRVSDKNSELENHLDFAIKKIDPLIRNRKNFEAILRRPSSCTTLGLGHIFLKAAGFGNADWDLLLEQAIGLGFDQLAERQPFRYLDSVWVNGLLGLPAPYNQEDILPFSIFNSINHPAFMTVNDAYVFTHTLMYLTDFGKQNPGNGIQINKVQETINASILWQLSEENFDLLGEFLACHVFLNDAWNEYSGGAWRYLCTVWDRLSFLPGPAFEQEVFKQAGEQEKTAYAFKETYHTNLVGALLCIALLARKKTDAPIPPHETPESEIYRRIEKYLTELPDNDTEYGVNPAFRNKSELIENIRKLIPHNSCKWLPMLIEGPNFENEKIKRLLELNLILSVRKYELKILHESLLAYIEISGAPDYLMLTCLDFLAFQEFRSSPGSKKEDSSMKIAMLRAIQSMQNKWFRHRVTDASL